MTQTGWLSQLARAVATLILLAIGIRLAWQLLISVLPALIVLGGLLAVVLLATSRWSRRSRW